MQWIWRVSAALVADNRMLTTGLLQITMWDLTNGKLIRTITDVHPPGTAILHVKVHRNSKPGVVVL